MIFLNICSREKISLCKRIKNLAITTAVLSISVISFFPFKQTTPLVGAGLIETYQKYRPIASIEPTSIENQQLGDPNKIQTGTLVSPSSALETALGVGANLNEEQSTTTTTLEFSSPMKRIMELIGGHSPVVVVSSNSAPVEQQQQPSGSPEPATPKLHQQPQGEHPLLAAVQANQQNVASQLAGSTDNRQHWTLLSPSQLISASVQPNLVSQQQQLIQTAALPYDTQYYLATPTSGAQSQQHFILPASLDFGAQANYQQPIPNLPTATTVQHQYQQLIDAQQLQQPQLQMQPQQQQEDKVQPIFLSSYVPELVAQVPGTSTTTSTAAGAGAGAGATSGSVEQRPNSIQQVQHAQVKAQEKPAQPNAGDGEQPVSNNDETSDNNDDSSNKSTNDEPDDMVSNGDIEEPSKIRRSNADNSDVPANDSHDGDAAEPESGSVSYENKFDSDKDEQPKTSLTFSGSTNRNGVSKLNKKSNEQLGGRSQPQTSGSSVQDGLINVGLNDDCMQCICRASSGCDDLLRCITRGSEEKYCGPFQLTEEYWNKAGSPGDSSNNFIPFEDCANDIDCAVETVTNYMKKYGKDCDGDDNITCIDYARLHKLKPNECENNDKLVNSFDAYWDKFQRCAEMYNRTRNGDDEDI